MKKRVGKSFILSLVFLLFLVGCGGNSAGSKDNGDGIKIGVLFSESGPTAMGEKGLKSASLLAIEEINAAGGVKGQKLIPVYEDYASDPSMAATKAKKLLLQDKVTAIVGGYTSASRQAVLPIVEQENGVLVYPMIFEGEEYSKNIMYFGPIPNQSLEQFIPWLTQNKGKKFFFIGNDYVFPVQTNKQAKELLKLNGGEVVGEEYVPVGHSEFASILNKIKEAKPDIIFSDLIAESAAAFYKQYADYGLNPDTMPIASIVTGEVDLAAMGASVGKGHISSTPYFQSIASEANKKFIENYYKKYGESPLDTNIQNAYYATHLLAKALEKAEDMNDADKLIAAFAGIEWEAPQGKVVVHKENHHVIMPMRIGMANEQGQFDLIHESEPIEPQPWSKLLFPNHDEPWKK